MGGVVTIRRMSLDPPPIRRQPLYEEIASRLRTLIAARHLEPGDRLPSERSSPATWGQPYIDPAGDRCAALDRTR